MTVTESTPLVYDPFSWEIQHNPYPTYTRLREEAPAYHNEVHGFWALSRHADVLAASLAPSTFVSSRGVTLEGVEQGQPLLILKDPPEHEWHRKVVSRVFTPKYVAGLEPYIRQVACELLDGLRGRESFDVIEEFSVQLPLRVAAELLGIPEDRRMPIHEASDRLVARNEDGSATDDAVAAQIELGVLMYEMVVEHKRDPVDGVFDLLVNSPVVEGDGSEHFLTEEELATRFLELAFAGHETVARLIPNGVVALTWTPDARRRLVADPTLIPTAVEEMLRWDAPFALPGALVDRGHRVARRHHPRGSAGDPRHRRRQPRPPGLRPPRDVRPRPGERPAPELRLRGAPVPRRQPRPHGDQGRLRGAAAPLPGLGARGGRHRPAPLRQRPGPRRPAHPTSLISTPSVISNPAPVISTPPVHA